MEDFKGIKVKLDNYEIFRTLGTGKNQKNSCHS